MAKTDIRNTAEDARLFAEELIAAHDNPEGVARGLREAAARCDQAAVRMSDGLRGADRKIYVPSKSRSRTPLTAELLAEAGVNFYLVVEPQEHLEYETRFPGRTLVLPENNRGISYSRTWIKHYSRERGEARHWQLDDNIQWFGHRDGKKNRKLRPNEITDQIFRHAEDIAGKYEKVGICGLTYAGWAFSKKSDLSFNVNCFSAVLVNNEPEVFWRPNVVDDVDYALQLLSKGWHTIQFNRLLMQKKDTLTGGITDAYLLREQQRKRLESHCRQWPGLFKIGTYYRMERFETFRLKPSRVWSRFNNPPRLKEGGEP